MQVFSNSKGFFLKQKPMFDWRELLLRNQNQPAQTDRTALKLLEEQLLHLLPPVVNALNATNILPLQPTWSKNEIALKFNIILEEVEQRYLVAWDHVRNAQIQKLEADYQTWYQAQLRSDKSLFSTYCWWQELKTALGLFLNRLSTYSRKRKYAVGGSVLECQQLSSSRTNSGYNYYPPQR